MRTIRDWYLNAEDGGLESPGFDPANDDRPDRHVDRWLDRAMTATAHRQRSTGNSPSRNRLPGALRPGSMPERPGQIFAARFPGRRTDLSDEFLAAVRKKRADNPTLSAGRLATELTRAGWRNVEAWHVHLAMSGRRSATPGQRLAQDGARVVRRRDQPHPSRRNAAPDRLGDTGRGGDPARDSSARTGGSRNERDLSNRQAEPAGRHHRPAARPAARPDAGAMFCPACDVRVSPLGRCRCS
jgi:hypothetical protein